MHAQNVWYELKKCLYKMVKSFSFLISNLWKLRHAVVHAIQARSLCLIVSFKIPGTCRLRRHYNLFWNLCVFLAARDHESDIKSSARSN